MKVDTLKKLPTELDIYLFHEGTLQEGYKIFGAHMTSREGIKGVHFLVWAPNALAVSVVGDFNQWDGSRHKMERIEQTGTWSLFIPMLGEGDLYKYEMLTPSGEKIMKADPYAFYSEKRPHTASIIYSLIKYAWCDQKWMEKRKRNEVYIKPMLIYEVHLGSWRKKADGSFYTYRELADSLLDHVIQCGFTHIEIMPIMEHPYDRSWGYQVTGYYSVTSRYGTPEDFMYFVDRCHQRNIGVILDWVPVHFCKDAHGLGRFDGTPLYESYDSRKAERPNWGTYNFDFEKPEVHSYLLSSIMFWLDVYHVDGFRIDAVSSMIYLNHDNHITGLRNKYGGEENLEAIQFLKALNEVVFQKHPGIVMMAEEATAYPLVSHPTNLGGLGFNYKWNMGWTNDVLRYMQLDMNERKYHHELLTFSMLYAFSENFVLPFSHDELVYGKRSLLNKMPGDYSRKFANLRLLYGYYMTHPGKKLLFMGSEFAQFDEWKDLMELDWNLLEYDSHLQFYHYCISFHHFYKKMSSLWRLDHVQEGFEWVDPNNSTQSIIIFIRKGKRKGDYCIVVCNFSNASYKEYRIGVPSFGSYLEVWNSDDTSFGGDGQCNDKPIQAEKIPFHNQPCSMEITVPSLGIAIFMKATKKRRKDVLEKWGQKNGSQCYLPGAKERD
ncbi:1,4-alpha-glucan branching protein GlgB [Bacillus sp. FJAT-49736]|uniref:1,4-alpha-glucan branching protein GlgB n=1 Tax=Bacillus sp. FJAT-49736 TaxID=2833582 RepID=UPI001BC9EA3E|nr:1,4-alpha-glucan branching protein GlgB [Bacillus sp. FJAT-49736]MBS4173068.1 1,4-alpha-glucan branching protein GlgB [Bacillus sp. FJAT-49736]